MLRHWSATAGSFEEDAADEEEAKSGAIHAGSIQILGSSEVPCLGVVEEAEVEEAEASTAEQNMVTTGSHSAQDLKRNVVTTGAYNPSPEAKMREAEDRN